MQCFGILSRTSHGTTGDSCEKRAHAVQSLVMSASNSKHVQVQLAQLSTGKREIPWLMLCCPQPPDQSNDLVPDVTSLFFELAVGRKHGSEEHFGALGAFASCPVFQHVFFLTFMIVRSFV